MSTAPRSLVLLPGLDGTQEPRAEFARELAPRVATTVIAYPRDLPWGYAALEAFVRGRLPQDQPYFILGESFSGPLAIRMAASPPPGLCGLILCSTFARSPYPALKPLRSLAAWAPVRHMPRWLRGSFMWGGNGRAKLAGALATVQGRVLRKRIAELLATDVTAALLRVTLPTLIIYGTQDRIVSARATRWLIEHAPGARAAAVDGPHLLLQTRARECAALIAAFVDDSGRLTG